MASIAELEEAVHSLEKFQKSLGEEIERIKEVYNPELRSRLIKNLQAQIFKFALNMPFDGTKIHRQ